MPPINDPSNTRSTFPFTRDTFQNRVDGLSSSSVLDAEIWNKIESAIYRMQIHQKKIVQKGDNLNHKRIRKNQVITVTSPTGLVVATFTLLPQEMNLIASNPFQLGNTYHVSVRAYDNAESYRTAIELHEPQTIKVRIQRMQASQNVGSGQYVVDLVLFGL